MSWLIWILFESVAALGAALGIVLFVLLVHWRRGGRGRPLLIGLAVAAAMLFVQMLVVTKREHAGRILKAIEDDIVASRTDALAAGLASDFDAGKFGKRRLDRDAFVAFVRRQMQAVDICWLDRWQLQVKDAQAHRFVCFVTYQSGIVTRAGTYSPRSGWSLTFVLAPEGWRIQNIRCQHIDTVSDPSWGSINRRP